MSQPLSVWHIQRIWIDCIFFVRDRPTQMILIIFQQIAIMALQAAGPTHLSGWYAKKMSRQTIIFATDRPWQLLFLTYLSMRLIHCFYILVVPITPPNIVRLPPVTTSTTPRHTHHGHNPNNPRHSNIETPKLRSQFLIMSWNPF